MLIDATRYNLWWNSPERFRLRECWKLAPVEAKPGTFASLLTYGRRRGTCLHELLDAKHKGISWPAAIADLVDGGFGNKEISAASKMADAIEEQYPGEKYLAHEVTFRYDVPDSPHSLVGRIDHILEDEDGVYVGDWKSTKVRTKKEMGYKGDTYCRSAQVSFYLLGARSLGFDTNRFLYRLVVDNPKGVDIIPFPTRRGNLELATFARGVHQTCELILHMKKEFGIESSWPNLPSAFDSDYQNIVGHRMYKDYIPEGFQPKIEHLQVMQEAEREN